MDYIRYPEIGDHLVIADNLARVPEIGEHFNIIAEDMVSVGSTAIGPANWIALAERIHAIVRDEPDTAGIVITHGTATLEETAYFLHLTVKTDRPVVITGAMRPPTSISTDADLNLMDAVRIAATPDAAGMGVLTVLNNEIHCARDVYKSNTLRVETFKPNELGFLGYADSDHQVVFYRRPFRKHTTDTPFTVDGRTGPAAGGHRVRLRWRRRNADRRRARPRVGRPGAGRVRRRHLPARRDNRRRAGRGRRDAGSARQPLQRRPRRDDTTQSGAGLHRVRQPDAAESPPFADAGPDGNHQPRRTTANVLRILTAAPSPVRG